MARTVPELRKKFRILIENGCFADWDEIGAALGKSAKTVQWWADGGADREPGTVPARGMPGLAKLFAEALPVPRSEAEVLALLFGPASELESEFRSAPTISLFRLIEDEADTSSGTLYRGGGSGTELVEVEQSQADDNPNPIVRLNECFRIEFRSTLHAPYVLAVQNVQQSWGSLAAGFDAKTRRIFLPGLDETTDKPVFMREPRDRGLHRFVALQTGEPMPVELRSAHQERITLDKSLLDRAAAFFASQPRSRRRIFVFELMVE